MIARSVLTTALLLTAFQASAQQPEYYKPYYLTYACNVGGQQAEMVMEVTPWPGDAGASYEPGPNPDITGAWAWGYSYYTKGYVTAGAYTYQFEGDSFGAMFWLNSDTQFDRFDAHFEHDANGMTIIVDPIMQRERYGRHYCQLIGRRD